MKFKAFFAFLIVIFTFRVSVVMGDVCYSDNTDLSNGAFEIDKDSKEPIVVWVVDDQTPAFLCYNSNSVNAKLNMRTVYRVVAGNYGIEYNQKKYSLLIGGEDTELKLENIVGWVSHDALLFHKNPLLNHDTNIYVKALIKEGDVNVGKGLQVYKTAKLEETSDAIEVRTIFYVYDFYPHSAESPDSQDTKSILISPLATLNHLGQNEPLLVGWVDRSKVSFWNTRIACEFPVGKSVTLTDESGKMVFQTEKIKRPSAYNSLRNPIIGESKDKQSYLIGAFSNLTPEQLGLKKRIEKVTTGLEVLFVIDGTRSMTYAFQETIKSVKEIAKKMEGDSQANNLEQPRFGLAVYRDVATFKAVKYGSGGELVPVDAAECMNEISVCTMGTINRFIQHLESQIACDGDKTYPESLYKGLIEGIKRTQFLEGASGAPKRLRIVIHIGDAGDNRSGGYSSSDVIKTFKDNDIYRYFSLDLSDSTHGGFKDSVMPIVNAYGEMGSYIKQKSDLANAVRLNLATGMQDSKKVASQIEIISRGFAGTNEGRIGVVSKEILEYAKKVIVANRISLKNYANFQQYVEGYVPKSVPLYKYILVEQSDIEKITYFLTSLMESADSESRKQAWNQFLKIILGEESCFKNGIELSIEECNRMRNGIPIKAGFMKYNREQFLNLDTQAVKEVICEAKVVREQLRLVVENKKPAEINFNASGFCDFTVITEYDLNGDGIIVRNDNVYEQRRGQLVLIRPAGPTDLIDQYFFRESQQSVAWIPLQDLEQVKINK